MARKATTVKKSGSTRKAAGKKTVSAKNTAPKRVTGAKKTGKSSPAVKEAAKSPAPKMKRNHKDTVFTDLFSDPKYLIRMYKALHPEDKRSGVKDISNISIHNVITNGIYNDLGFSIKGSLVLLVEAQSTWSVNIIIRLLLYLAETYNKLFTENDIDLYGEKKAPIPKPELYVIFTGKGKKPEQISLSKEFFGGAATDVDVKVKVISDSERGDIIGQYIAFTKVADEQVKKYGYTKKAAEETIRICKDKDILAEYLKEREVEVMDIMTTLFDQDEVTRRYQANRDREIAEKAEKKGKNKEKSDNISKMAEYFMKENKGLSRAEAVKMAKGILK